MNSNIKDIFQQALTSHQEGKLEEAMVIYKKILEIKPNLAEAHNNLGIILQQLNRNDEAEKSFKKALEIRPNFADAHNNLGIVFHLMKKLDEAKESFNKAVELKHDYFVAYNNLGKIFHQLNKLDEAEESFKKALKIKPDFIEALNNKGTILFKKKKFELSLKDFDNINTSTSRFSALLSLYGLGRIDEIYERIKINSKLDEKNLSVAAFASFIAAKEKKDTANKFCNKPLDFIKFSNLSSHLKNSNSFIDEVIEELGNVKTRWEPLDKTTIKGFQSEKYINLFQDPSGKMNNLKSIILDEIDSYYFKFKDENCTFIQNWPAKKNIKGWYVILKQQGYQNAHIHPSGWLSGVIYLKVVPPLEQNEGAIEFSLNGDYYFDENSPKIMHEPKVGDIVLFPSSLHHRTIPFSTDADRIIVSFDSRPN